MNLSALLHGVVLLIGTIGMSAQYYAICADGHGTQGWYGTTRNTYAEAQRDANAHKQAFPAHDPQVVSFSSASEAQHDGTTTLLTSAEQAQATWPQHFVYDFEAYDHGRFVQSMHWETDAVSQQHLLQLMANAQAGFTQRLNDARIPWNAVYPIFRSSRPIR
jgi:hypothetical protein